MKILFATCNVICRASLAEGRFWHVMPEFSAFFGCGGGGGRRKKRSFTQAPVSNMGARKEGARECQPRIPFFLAPGEVVAD